MVVAGRSPGNVKDKGDGSSQKRVYRSTDRGNEVSPKTILKCTLRKGLVGSSYREGRELMSK